MAVGVNWAFGYLADSSQRSLISTLPVSGHLWPEYHAGSEAVPAGLRQHHLARGENASGAPQTPARNRLVRAASAPPFGGAATA